MTYLTLPSGSTEFKRTIHSSNLAELLTHESPIEYLRKLYSADIQLFYVVRDEMLLRGINLAEELQNNFFPQTKYVDSPVISIEENHYKYKDIDFNLMNLPNFNDKFRVNSDLFFNNIPIQGFTALSKNTSLEFISNIFQEAGFTLKYLDVFSENEKITENNELIHDVFPKSEFLSFHRYCFEKNYVHVSQLNKSIIEDFIHQPQVGEKKVLKVLNRYESYLKSTAPLSLDNLINSSLNFFTNNSFSSLCRKTNTDYLIVIENFYKENFFTELESPESQLYLNNIKTIISESIKKKNQMELEDLLIKFNSKPYTPFLMDIEVSNLKKMLAKKRIKTKWPFFEKGTLLEEVITESNSKIIINDLIDFQETIITIKEQIESIKLKLSEKEIKCYILRTEHSLTLQAIAEQVGITRERVRQIVKNVEKKIAKFTDKTNLSIVLEFLPKYGLGISPEEISNFYNVDSKSDFIFLDCMLRKSDKLILNDILNVYTSKEINNHIIKKFNELDNLDNVLSPIEVSNHFNTLDAEIVEDRELIEKINEIMSLKGYVKPGKLYFKKNYSFKEKISYIFKNHINEPIKMDSNGLQLFSNLFKKYFGSELPSNENYVIERIRETENILLVNPLTFSYFDPNAVEPFFISRLKKIIEDKLFTKEWVSINEVFSENQKLANSNSISSKVHLYSLLQYFLSEYFEIGKGNTLNIYRPNALKLKSEDSLEYYLNDFKGSVKKETILTHFHWPQYKLDQLVSSSDKFISFDSSTIMLFSKLNLNSEDKNLIINFLKYHLNSGYAFCFEIFQEMQFDEKLNAILIKYGIKNHYALLQLLKKIVPEVKGHANFLYYENAYINSAEKYIINHFSSFTSRKEIYEDMLEKGYSEQMSQSIVRELMEKRHFLDYERNKILNKKALSINQDTMDSFKAYLAEAFKEKPYLSITKLIGFKTHLPKLNIGDWTKHLIYHLGAEAGFRAIKTANDYRFDKLLLVKSDSPFHIYEDLVKFVLENEYSGPLHENNVAKFLSEAGLAHNDQKFSYELKSSPLFSIDTLGWITIEEET